MKSITLTLLGLCSLAVSSFAANNLVNSGFEDPITYDGSPFVGSWEGFSSVGSTAANSSTMPYSGLQSLELSIASTPNTFAGTFQDVDGLSAGIEYTFAGWHATSSDPLELGVEIRIEWRDSVNDIEISRTPNATPVPTASYSPFSLTAAVPAGADTARVVYAIQSFSTAPQGNGVVFVDDTSFTVVPEPTAFVLLTLGGLALLRVRRNRI